MSSPGFSRGWKKGLRTVAQVIAAGGLTALVTAVAGGLSPQMSALVIGAFTALVAFCMNWAEGAGKIGVLLPTPSLVVGPAAGAVAAVEAVADQAGGIVGDVTDIAGDVVGTVTGQLDDDNERGGAGMVTLAAIIFLVLLMVGGFAVCDLVFDDESEPGDKHLLGRVELVSHDYDDGWEEEGGGQNYEDQWSNEDENRNRNRNRGAFSPGPFDDSPVDAFNNVCMPGATCTYNPGPGDEPPPEEGEPE